jgi:large repetitive protein
MQVRLAFTVASVLVFTAIAHAVAPGAPQNLAANVSGNTVTLSWAAPSTGGVPTGYVVNASLSPGGPLVASLPVSATSLAVADVPFGVYYVHVRAVNIDGSSAPSNEVIVSVPSGPGGCTTPPNAPSNLTATVNGSLVDLTWTPPVSGCAATAYAVQAGSAPGLSDLAILNVGAATSLSVVAPPGVYYVRVVAMNAFGGSVGSVEVVVTVGISRERVTITFDGLSGVASGSPVTTYAESNFTVTPTAAQWVALTTFGNPAPFIQFTRTAAQAAITGEVTIDAGGATFEFESVDLYSSITMIPYQIIGVRHGAPMFAVSGTVPNTFGQFATVSNPHTTTRVDTLIIRVTNPATACCSNPVGIDNIAVAR